MKIDENLYSAYLQEVNALESFRLGFSAMHPGVPLDREDPDIRRLIEAMALFSARSRMAGTRNIDANRHRLFRQFFPFLLSPLPSMAMMQSLPTRQLAEPVTLSHGSELTLAAEAGGTALFRTLYDLRVLPIAAAGLTPLLLPDGGHRFCLSYRAAFPRSEEIGDLNLFINHLDNYESSLRVLHTLKQHLRGVSVVYDQRPDETSVGTPCEPSFGEVRKQGLDFGHPLERERQFFHFPWQELFFNVRVAKAEKNWSQFTLCVDVDANWPRTLVLNQEVFRAFAVPIVNNLQAMAQPVVCDGTKERYPIRHPDIVAGFALHSVKGVYEASKTGMTPLKHCIFSGEGASYETDEATDEQGRKTQYLHVRHPDAFFEPTTIAIDALWLQPWFSEVLAQRIVLAPYNRTLTGVKWELPVLPVRHRENPFVNNLDGLLHFLTLTNKAVLDREDLLDIFRALGIYENPHFEPLCRLLVSVVVDRVPIPGIGSGGLLKHRYRLGFSTYDASRGPLMEVFLAHVEKILKAWISGVEIELQQESVGREFGGEPEGMKSS
jgi:type VI secretion system protein ImpG